MQHYFLKNLENNIATFDESDIHHILHVMRFKNNDKVIGVFDHKKYQLSIVIEKDNCYGEVIEELSSMSSKVKMTIIHGLPKLDKFELSLQKVCEIGANVIVPFLSDRSIIKLDEKDSIKKLERWEKILKEASEQSERFDIPKVEKPIKFDKISSFLSDLNIVLDEKIARSEGNNLLEVLTNNSFKSITVLVGPEGGFSDKEIDGFHKLGFKSVSLGNSILRSETAVIYIASCISMVTK